MSANTEVVQQISVVIITQDEADRVTNAIQSCKPFADEIVVVDGGSQDNTISIANQLGCRVLSNAWPGYAPQRNYGAQQATHDWVFFIDSDEVVGDDLAQALIVWKHDPHQCNQAFSVNRINDFLGIWLTSGIDDQIRLYNNRESQIIDVLVHERPDVDLSEVERLPGVLWHYGFRDIADQIERFNRYTTLEAQRDYKTGSRFNLLRLIFKPIARFGQRYILRGFFKRGLPGFIYSIFWAHYDFLKEVKLYELELLMPDASARHFSKPLSRKGSPEPINSECQPNNQATPITAAND